MPFGRDTHVVPHNIVLGVLIHHRKGRFGVRTGPPEQWGTISLFLFIFVLFMFRFFIDCPIICDYHEAVIVYSVLHIFFVYMTDKTVEMVVKDLLLADNQKKMWLPLTTVMVIVICILPGFPVIHSSPLVRWQQVSNFSLLYVVSGANVHLLPYLLLAHLDVVPADDATKWDVPPFSAEIHDGFLYGRGAIDDKHSVFVCNCRYCYCVFFICVVNVIRFHSQGYTKVKWKICYCSQLTT